MNSQATETWIRIYKCWQIITLIWNDCLCKIFIPVLILVCTASIVACNVLGLRYSHSSIFTVLLFINSTAVGISAYMMFSYKSKEYELSRLSLKRRKCTADTKLLKLYLDSCRHNGSNVGPFCILNDEILLLLFYSVVNYTATFLVIIS